MEAGPRPNLPLPHRELAATLTDTVSPLQFAVHFLFDQRCASRAAEGARATIMFARPILIEHPDADTEHVYFFDFHRRLRLALCLDFSFCGARCSKSSKSLGRAVARLFRRKGPMPM